ncbi:hypothetical protein ACQY0O_005844 [Thecaphora frezii]
MPLYPTQEPSRDDFATQPSLESLPDEQPRGGPAPWRQHTTSVAGSSSSSSSPKPTDNAPQNDGSAPDFDRDASPIVFGCGVFGQDMYNTAQTLASDVPLRTVRLALRYGINAFDTSPYYFPSEFILGNILQRLAPEFPRESYFIMTKCGRYGPEREHFDYSPQRVDSSIRASCEKRIGCGYLDVALMHDVEFVAEHVGPSNQAGWEAGIVSGLVDADSNATVDETLASLGLEATPEAAAKIHGPGDEKVLAAVRTLFKLKDEGIVKRVGISGYLLPVLLRLSRLVASHAPFRPLDVVLSYSNHCLHSDVLVGWRRLFEADPSGGAGAGTGVGAAGAAAWKPPVLLNGSPFSMGLLVDGPPPAWHPASEALKQACRDASATLQQRGESLAATALAYGLKGTQLQHAQRAHQPQLRTLVGLSNPEQVHSIVETYRTLCAAPEAEQEAADKLLYPLQGDERESRVEPYRRQIRAEQEVRTLFQKRGVREWSWSSGL